MLVGIVDTTFSRVDMGAIAVDELRKNYPDVRFIRRTVPGIKDLAVECKRLLEIDKCDIAMALGMAGKEKIDTQCAHEASLGIQMAKIATNRHIVEVIVHEFEADSPDKLHGVFEDRTRKHVHNAVRLVREPDWLVKNAGKGLRQGGEHAGELAHVK